MSQWTHPICDDCFRRKYGDRRPTRLVEPEREDCCVCGDPTDSGIYFREDPASPTLAAHKDHDR